MKRRSVVGGNIAFSHTGVESFSLGEVTGLTGPSPLREPTTHASGGSTANTVLATLVGSRRFGNEGRTSIGLGLDVLSQRASLNQTTQFDAGGLTSRERTESRSMINRMRISIGLAANVGVASKLGIYYRHGNISASDRNRSRTLDGDPLPLETISVTGRSSELGMRLRGPITRRLFYGVEGSLLRASSSEISRSAVDANEHSRSRRAVVGVGLGYVLRARTLLAFDVAAGLSHTRNRRLEDATGNVLEYERQTARFLSLHAAIQSDVWHRFFVSGSILSLIQSRATHLELLPNRFGQRRSSDGIVASGGLSKDKFTDYFSNFGVGWRFTPRLLAEYVVSTDFGQTSPRHTFMLRYTFNLGGR